VILSKDTGFDPLIKHLVRRGFSVRRAASVAAAFQSRTPAAAAAEKGSAAAADKALSWLTALQKNKRPRKHKRLSAFLQSRFGEKVPEREVLALIAAMIESGTLTESDGTITYHF
jgi:hypothetical protein